jgi:uncharacterized protein (TIGR02466 family)
MEPFELLPLFSIPVYISSLDIDDDTVTLIENTEFKRLDINNGDRSKDTYILNSERFKNLRSSIMNHVDRLVKEVFFVEKYINFEMKNSWIMRHTTGDYAGGHVHPNSMLSGILYIKTDDQSGNLIFKKSPNHLTVFSGNLELPVKEYNIFNSTSWSITPKTNQLIIFPSHLVHEVTRCISNNVRYCIAFNLFPTGTLGLTDAESISILELK